MSYILDALNKAESERRLGSVPNLHAQRVSLQSPVRGTSLWSRPLLWIALAALIIAIGSLAWLKPWQTAPAADKTAVFPGQSVPVTSNAESRPVGQTSVAAPIVAATASLPAPAVIAATPAAIPTPPADGVVAEKTIPAERIAPKSERKQAKKLKENKPAIAAKPDGSARATKSEAVQAVVALSGNSVGTLRELPANIQREIPALTIGGYIYSGNQSERSVLINKRLLHEGDEVAPGLTLEKMFPHEVVLNYKGYRYRISY